MRDNDTRAAVLALFGGLVITASAIGASNEVSRILAVRRHLASVLEYENC